MFYLALVIALAFGYIAGVVQNGINITVNNPANEAPEDYNKSVGIEEFKKYYDETGGMNKF